MSRLFLNCYHKQSFISVTEIKHLRQKGYLQRLSNINLLFSLLCEFCFVHVANAVGWATNLPKQMALDHPYDWLLSRLNERGGGLTGLTRHRCWFRQKVESFFGKIVLSLPSCCAA